jgi:hypothetical protein
VIIHGAEKPKVTDVVGVKVCFPESPLPCCPPHLLAFSSYVLL